MTIREGFFIIVTLAILFVGLSLAGTVLKPPTRVILQCKDIAKKQGWLKPELAENKEWVDSFEEYLPNKTWNGVYNADWNKNDLLND